jgi:YidC/Oxa1 family membrane protein insertase
MEKRTVIAIVLTILILFLWQFYMPSKKPGTSPQTATQPGNQSAQTPAATGQGQPTVSERTQTAPTTGSPSASPAAPAAAAAAKSTKQITVNTPKLRVTFGDLGGGMTSVRLKEYKEVVGKSEGKEILENLAPYQYLPVVSQMAAGKGATDATLFTADRGDITVTDKPETLVFTGTLTNGTKVKKIYTFKPDSYGVDLSVEAQGEDNTPVFADFAAMSIKKKSSYVFKGPFVYNGKKLDQVSKIEGSVNIEQSYAYTGFDLGYFSLIVAPKPETRPNLVIIKSEDTPIDRFALNGGRMESALYFVPNKLSLLKQLNIGAEKIVNFGWFDILAKPMLWGMNWANRFTRNYGIDIILLTILIKIIFYPLSLKSYKSMKQMQKLKPMIDKLREKYKDDKEKLNKEMMDIYKTKGINPLGGCLPMVVQIPVFFALYRVLMQAIEFRHAPFMLWINDLAAPEDLFSFTAAGYTIPIRILPLVMGITMFIQQKMTPMSADPMQEKMMLFMPILFTFLFWSFPTGLVLYWLVNNVISIGQQYYINKQVA